MLSQDFKEFIQFLNSNDVRYLIVGGYALALHGHPRYTKDLDIWIDSEKENAKRLLLALKDFGFESLGLKENDFLENKQVIQLGYPPNRIDLLTSIDGVSFADCHKSARKIETDGVSVSFIDLEGLKANKRASGRLQDLADLETLENSEKER